MQECKIKIQNRENLINGGFICCWLSHETKKFVRCWVKLTEIKSIQEAGEQDGKEVNVIYTYRDIYYYVFLDAELIVKAINEFSSKEAENARTKPVVKGIYAGAPIEC